MKDIFDNFANCLILTYSMLLVVSIPKLPDRWSVRLLTGWWWIYCVLGNNLDLLFTENYLIYSVFSGLRLSSFSNFHSSESAAEVLKYKSKFFRFIQINSFSD